MPTPCPVCDSGNVRDHKRAGVFQTVRCADCKLIFTQNINQDDLIRFYDEAYYKNDSLLGYKDYLAEEKGHRTNARSLLAQADRVLPLKGKTVLDVGCAAGFLLDEARKLYGCAVCGVEPSSAMQGHAQNILGLDVRQTTLQDSGLQSESFDAIFFIGTLEHLLDPREVLTAMFRLLKKGGLLALTTIDTGGWFPLYAIKPPEHTIYFSHENVRLLLAQCGYGDIRHFTKFSLYRVADVCHRLHEFFGLGLFRWAEKLLEKTAPGLHWNIPTNEMTVLARKP